MLYSYCNQTNSIFVKALVAIGGESDAGKLLAMVMKAGSVNLECMALLDKANTETYGNPVPTTVPLTIEAGSFIVAWARPLRPAPSAGDVYTHSEMLPAHAYPQLP